LLKYGAFRKFNNERSQRHEAPAPFSGPDGQNVSGAATERILTDILVFPLPSDAITDYGG